nr:MAG TPA_asm: hypothetical protein [Caudoviricetes sp.]
MACLTGRSARRRRPSTPAALCRSRLNSSLHPKNTACRLTS